MVAYVTKAGLGPESEFALLCRSFFRWSSLVLRPHAYLHCLHCPFFRWSHGGVGIVVLADSRRQVLPGRPVPSLFQLRQGVSKFKIRLRVSQGLAGVLWPHISHLHPLRKIELKNQPNTSINKKVWFLTLLESFKPKIFQTPLEISQKLCSSRNTCRIAGIKVVSSPLQDRQK